MTLDDQSTHPSTRSYVLKLHRDALSGNAKLMGRLENMASGRHFDFRSGEDLLACLACDLASDDSGTPHVVGKS